MNNLTLVAVFMVPLLILGMFGNLNLIYATWKFKELRNRNSMLLAIIAFLDFISEIHEWKKAIEIFLNKAIMKRITCYHSLFLYCYSFNMSSVAILFLAIDRFIAVRSPLKYRTARSTPFIALAIGTGFTYSTLFVIAGFLLANDNLVEPCDQTMAYSPLLMGIWNYGSVSIAVAVFIINVINYYLLRNVGKQREIHERDYAAYQRQNQFTTSMLITMIANCLTSLLSAFALFIVNLLPVSVETIVSCISKLTILNY
uniref:G-protein coupled receptors family 1 profile domain-containing protein n=2 Tax=Wuchereria bancrofti TaxID=6293 RepID=A0AAF5PX88_WUCBA